MKTSNGWNAEDAWDEAKLRTWTDANTAILYASCYGRSRDLMAAFLFTLKFDDAGNWKIIKTHQMTTNGSKTNNEIIVHLQMRRKS